MRIIVVALLGLGPLAHADDFASFELAAGGHLPVGDSAWKSATTGSPALFGGVAWHLGEHFGVLGSGEALDPLGLVSPSGTYKLSILRLRFLAHAFYEDEVVPHLTLAVRFGIGLDTMFVNWDMPTGGNASYRSEQISALAFEPAAGLWYDAGIGVQVGGEVAIPISTARDSQIIGSKAAGVPASFASYEFAVLAGIRITSKRD
ncbi:MAG: hypothetical protein ABJE66_12695 [Deltaproteobacteria bacterium]